MILTLIAQRIGGEQYQQRAQAFAARFHQIMANIFNQTDLRVELIDNELVDCAEVVFNGLMEWQHGSFLFVGNGLLSRIGYLLAPGKFQAAMLAVEA